MPHQDKIGNEFTIELGVCPFCDSLTDFRGEFLPCCGENIDAIPRKKWRTVLKLKAKVIGSYKFRKAPPSFKEN